MLSAEGQRRLGGEGGGTGRPHETSPRRQAPTTRRELPAPTYPNDRRILPSMVSPDAKEVTVLDALLLTVRFVLELAALAALVWWGVRTGETLAAKVLL